MSPSKVFSRATPGIPFSGATYSILILSFLARVPSSLLNIYVQLCIHCHNDLTIFCKREKVSICTFSSFIQSFRDAFLAAILTCIPLRFCPLFFDTPTNSEFCIDGTCFKCFWFLLMHYKYPETSEMYSLHRKD